MQEIIGGTNINKILQVHVPNNCTDLFQPLNLSVNKSFKDKLQSK